MDVFFSILSGIIVDTCVQHLIAFASFKIGLLVCFVLFIILPLVFKFSYKFQQSVIFLNFAKQRSVSYRFITATILRLFISLFAYSNSPYKNLVTLIRIVDTWCFFISSYLNFKVFRTVSVNWPKDPDFSKPEKYDIDGVRNFYLQTDDQMRLGVWQILPESLQNSTELEDETKFFDDALNNGQNVILYNHGNSGHRAAPHRIELYKVLRQHFHVIAFDYRGYGDSTDVDPTEKALVSDCIFMYKWLQKHTKSRIFVWGHSLGTGLSSHMLSLLGKEGIRPAGLIMESPFTSMREEVGEHPFAWLFKALPWFHYTVIEPMQANNLTFATDRHILNIDCPILILHAEDDRVVPFKLGLKLYQLAQEYRKPTQGSVKFLGFDRKLGYGHKHICRAPQLADVLVEFETSAQAEAETKNL